MMWKGIRPPRGLFEFHLVLEEVSDQLDGLFLFKGFEVVDGVFKQNALDDSVKLLLGGELHWNLLNILLEILQRAVEENLLFVQNDYFVKVVHDVAVEILHRADDGHSLGLQLKEQLKKRLLLRIVEFFKGILQEQDVGLVEYLNGQI